MTAPDGHAAPAWRGDTLVFHARVQPRAAQEELTCRGGEIRIRITAPPVDGKANAAIVKLLARAFGVPRSHVVVERGATGRNKRIAVTAPQRLPDALGPVPPPP